MELHQPAEEDHGRVQREDQDQAGDVVDADEHRDHDHHQRRRERVLDPAGRVDPPRDASLVPAVQPRRGEREVRHGGEEQERRDERPDPQPEQLLLNGHERVGHRAHAEERARDRQRERARERQHRRALGEVECAHRAVPAAQTDQLRPHRGAFGRPCRDVCAHLHRLLPPVCRPARVDRAGRHAAGPVRGSAPC